MKKVSIQFICVGIFIFIVVQYGICKSFAEDISKTAQDYFLEGQEYIEQENYVKANESFKKAELLMEGKTNKNNTESKDKYESRNSIGNKDYIDSDSGQGIFKKAENACLRKDWNKAVKLYSEGLLKNKDNSDIHYNLGVIALRKFDYLKANAHIIKPFCHCRKQA